MKYKHVIELFNCKLDTKSVNDFCACMQQLVREVGANDELLRFAVLNGLRPDIKNHVTLTMQQPKTWNELVQSARVGEMCVPVVPPPDTNVAVQIELMRDQLNQLSIERRANTVSGQSRIATLRRREWSVSTKIMVNVQMVVGRAH